jgi:hypothetical protein
VTNTNQWPSYVSYSLRKCLDGGTRKDEEGWDGRSRVRVKEYSLKIVDEVIPQKIRDEVNLGLIPSRPSLTLNQTLPKPPTSKGSRLDNGM